MIMHSILVLTGSIVLAMCELALRECKSLMYRRRWRVSCLDFMASA